jgi:asparagine synthase (glutamine-hydrolysing)
MTVDAGGMPTLRAYWTPAYHPSEPRSEAAWIERFRDEWLDTIGKQMVADVDVGAFLSGGVDSSAVVAAMAQVSDRPVRTFTIGFPDPRFDESPHAVRARSGPHPAHAPSYATARAAHRSGCHHVTRTLELADAQAMLPEVQHCYDEPFADPSAVPTWYVSQIAAQEVKVALSGDGGDELFFGYKRHATERRIGALPAPLRSLARALDAVPTLPSRHANAVLQRWRKTTGSAALPNGIARFFAKTQITNEAFRREIFSAEFIAEEEGGIAALVAEYFPDPDAISTDTLEQFGLADLALNLPGAMLTKVDRASMAHSLEVRVPMLGQGMVDLALSMPADMKLHGKIGKYVIRQAIAPWLPEGILDRRKQGFQMPLAAWFAGDFGAYAEQLWRDSGVREQGIWRPGAVDKVFADHRAGKRDHSRFLYALAIYCLWWIGRPKALAVTTF